MDQLKHQLYTACYDCKMLQILQIFLTFILIVFAQNLETEQKNDSEFCQCNLGIQEQMVALQKRMTELSRTTLGYEKQLIAKNEQIQAQTDQIQAQNEHIKTLQQQNRQCTESSGSLSELTKSLTSKQEDILNLLQSHESSVNSTLAVMQDTAEKSLAEQQVQRRQKFNFYSGVETLNGRKYFFSFNVTKRNWMDARTFCMNHGMDLLSIETKEEEDILSPHLKRLSNKHNSFFWTSGLESTIKNDWTWGATGQKITYTRFTNSCMDNTNTCLYVYYGGFPNWCNQACSYNVPFVCEMNQPYFN